MIGHETLELLALVLGKFDRLSQQDCFTALPEIGREIQQVFSSRAFCATLDGAGIYRDAFLKVATGDVFCARDLAEYCHEFTFLNTEANCLQIQNLAYCIDRRIQLFSLYNALTSLLPFGDAPNADISVLILMNVNIATLANGFPKRRSVKMRPSFYGRLRLAPDQSSRLRLMKFRERRSSFRS